MPEIYFFRPEKMFSEMDIFWAKRLFSPKKRRYSDRVFHFLKGGSSLPIAAMEGLLVDRRGFKSLGRDAKRYPRAVKV